VRRDLGDFQTPPELVDAVLETLGPIGARWPRVLEPTCGRGNFVAGLLRHTSPPREIRGIEIQPDHCRTAEACVGSRADIGSRVSITCADVFRLDLGRDLIWQEDGPLLVLGNPPWVTSAELGRLSDAHVPPKANIKGLAGLEARTGSSNFDVAEAIWLKLARDLAAEDLTIAILCKNSVARGILQFARRAGLPVLDASIRRIDAARWFGATVDACLFGATLAAGRSGGEVASPRCAGVPFFPSLGSSEPARVLGFARGWLVADREAYGRSAFADGTCPKIWRQGLKHDAAAVMELSVEPGTGRLRNRAGEDVEVETGFVYPLLKGADLRRPADERPARAVLVTQERIGHDTKRLASSAPRLWAYLSARADRFDRRRSSIYRGRSPFAIFGVGPYSFAPYKVAVAGLSKAPAFRAVGPRGGRPVMFDDTCYFLPCSSAPEAVALSALCNDPFALGFLASASFPDAKRPITKALLQRLDLRAILERADRPRLRERAARSMAVELGIAASLGLMDQVEEALAMVERVDSGSANLGAGVVGVAVEGE
jgi:hypothetical protein